MSSAYRPCPHCGLPNIRERHICKRCRSYMDAPVTRRSAATEQTGHLYRDASGRAVLFVVPAFLEYTAPGLTIRTEWNNLLRIEQANHGPFLTLANPAALNVTFEHNTPVDNKLFRTIPLAPFGYPANTDLLADLLRFAPHLRRRR